MRIDKKHLEKFKKIYKKEFGVSLGEKELEEKAQKVLSLFKLLSKN